LPEGRCGAGHQDPGRNIISLHISDDDGIDERHWYPGNGVLSWNEITEAGKIAENYELLMRNYRAAK
jgi:hypothetical protein